MQGWDRYRQVKIDRGNLIDCIKNYTQQDWIKTLNKLGVIVRTDYGRGSHAVAYKDNCPPGDIRCVVTTLVKHMHEEIQRPTFKKVLAYGLESGKYNEDDIWRALGIKIR